MTLHQGAIMLKLKGKISQNSTPESIINFHYCKKNETDSADQLPTQKL